MKATLFFGFSLFHVGEFYISVRGVVKRLAGAYRRGSRPSRNGGGLPGGGLRKYADFPRRGKSARSLGLLPRSAFAGSRSMPAAPRYAFLRPTALASPRRRVPVSGPLLATGGVGEVISIRKGVLRVFGIILPASFGRIPGVLFRLILYPGEEGAVRKSVFRLVYPALARREPRSLEAAGTRGLRVSRESDWGGSRVTRSPIPQNCASHLSRMIGIKWAYSPT